MRRRAAACATLGRGPGRGHERRLQSAANVVGVEVDADRDQVAGSARMERVMHLRVPAHDVDDVLPVASGGADADLPLEPVGRAWGAETGRAARRGRWTRAL